MIINNRSRCIYFSYHTNRMDNELIHQYLNVTVDVNDVAKQQTAIVFGNQHFSLTGIRPHSKQFVEIGGIHIKEKTVNETLPPAIETFLNSSRDGDDVLFISWGSMIRASTMDGNKVKTILTVLKKHNIRVIWKWETEEVPVNDDRILFVKWAPQLTLLCEYNINLLKILDFHRSFVTFSVFNIHFI